MKFFLPIVFLISLNLFARQTDTTPADTIKIISDSLSSVSKDSLASDTTGYIQADTLYPLYQKSFYSESFFTNREIINKLGYRYTGDLFSTAGFSLLKDKGLIGQQNELALYGNRVGDIGFFSDGILNNNRYTNILDLNFIQNELIDSIEILPLPRGFLYGPDNYISAVNFIEKDFLTPAPYTRIKYYEGPDGEAFFDGIFNTTLFNKLNFTFDVTNRKFDSTYTDSDFSIWQAKFKLKYFLSNKINFIGSYSLVNSELGLNGGVDVDSIAKVTDDINSILYEPFTAPVIYPALKQEVNLDKLGLRMLGSFGDFNSDLNFYYHSVKENYSGIVSKDEIKSFTWGTALRQEYSTEGIHLEVNGVFERRQSRYYYVDALTGVQNIKSNYNVFSISPVVTMYFLDSTIVPSAFYKNTNYSGIGKSYHGIGGDFTVKLFKMIDLYFGISKFDFFGLETDVNEIGARISYKDLFANVKFYNKKNLMISYELFPDMLMPSFNMLGSSSGDLTGVSLNLNYDFWKFGFEGGFNYNSYKKDENSFTSEIKMHLNSGIFYKDILFNQNLDLKTGFVFKYYDFESDKFESASQFDFTLAGIIKKVAIVYFSWENLLDKKYFIVPYYPMRGRGIRFGIAWELFN